jgi:hypothetical protein
MYAAESKTLNCSAPGCERGARSKGLCGAHYQRVRTYGTLDLPARKPNEQTKCSVEDCSNNARTINGSLCEMHYGRRRRNGDFRSPAYGRVALTSHGYRVIYDPTHEIAPASGVLYEHRAVLFGAIGEGPHACRWCDRLVVWRGKGRGKLVVDHLDGVKTNNDPSNLLPSCAQCNSTRGLFQKWAMDHKDDPFLRAVFAGSQESGKDGDGYPIEGMHQSGAPSGR